MAGIFGGSAGPVGSNISDYTSLPFSPNASTTMGPVANPQAYTEALGYSGMGPVASGAQYGQFLEQQQQPSTLSQIGSGLENAAQSFKDVSALMGPTAPPMQFNKLMPARPQVQLQQANLMDFLSMLGGSR